MAAMTEPLIPALLKPLFDRGFQRDGFNLWAGQAHPLAEERPAAEIVARLVAGAARRVAGVAARLTAGA